MDPAARASFADEHGWGWGALRDRLESHDWLAPGREEEATAVATDLAERASASVKAWAAARKTDVPRAVRNLIAEAPASDLALWRIVLAAKAAGGPADRSEQAPLVGVLPTAGTPETRVLEALITGQPVGVNDLAAVLPPGSTRPAEFAVGRILRERGPVPAADLVGHVADHATALSGRLTLQLVKRAAYYYPPSEPLTFDSAIALGRHPVGLLIRWPHLIRQLEGRPPAPHHGREPKTVIPVEGLAAELGAWRLERRLETLDAAIAAIGARDYDSDALSELAADRWFRVIPEDQLADFEMAILREIEGPAPATSVEAAGSIARQLPPRLGIACRFILSAPVDRVAVLREASREQQIALLQLVDASEMIATLAAPDLSRADVELLVGVIDGTRHEAPVLEALLESGRAGSSAPLPAQVTAAWLEVDYVDDDDAQELIRRGLPFLQPGPGTLVNLASVDLAELPSADLLRFLLATDVSLQLRGYHPGRWESLYGRVLAVADAYGWLKSVPDADPEVTVLEATMDFVPDATLEYLTEHDRLLDAGIAEHIPLPVLLEWLDANGGQQQLQRIAGQARDRNVDLPDVVRAAAMERPDYLEATIDAAASLLSPRRLVELALDSRDSAEVVDARLTPAERRELMPWVRERFADKPAQAVASELAVAFGLGYAGYLRHLAGRAGKPADDQRRGHQLDDLYRTYELPKKRGGNRTITVPARVLRGLQRAILINGFEAVPVHDAATGFRKHRSIRDNAEPHAGKPIVVNIDIASFFPSTRYESVVRACRQLHRGQLSPAAIRLVADICCYDGGLPIGAPTSPAIANVILRQVDTALTTAAERHDVTYTRYADDLTFSGDERALKLIPFARRLLAELGYELDRRKTNVYRRGRRQIVTGLVVNERADLPRRTRRRLRAALHRRENGKTPEWHGRPMTDAQLTGWLAYRAMLHPDAGADELDRVRALGQIEDRMRALGKAEPRVNARALRRRTRRRP